MLASAPLLLPKTAVLLLSAFAVVQAVLPAPHDALFADELLNFRLSPAFDITGFLLPSDLQAAVERTLRYIATDNHGRMIVGRGETDRESLASPSTPVLVRLELSILGSGAPTARVYPSISEEINKPYEDLDESYIFEILPQVPTAGPPSPLDVQIPLLGPYVNYSGSNQFAHLRANTSLGLFRGLESFSQMVYTLPPRPNHTADQAVRYLHNPPTFMYDAPQFPHRGLMLDTSRNFYPIPDIERTLDAMSWAKLNVFHWHATDSPSFPVSLPSFPLLSQHGAYSPSQTYSVSDTEHLVRYANERGIQVLLEIDLPGHTASMGASYPEFLVCLQKDSAQDDWDWKRWAVQPPTGQIKLGDVEAQAWVEDVVRDAISLVRGSRYFSTGGDEINKNCYDYLESLNLTLDDALAAFHNGVHRVLQEEGKTPVVWEELVLNHDLGLSNETIVIVWNSSANVGPVLDQGFRVVIAASDFFYLDCGGGGWLGNSLGNSWCDPYKTWQKIYSFDPYANVSEQHRHLIMGGQTLLWSEQSDPSNLDSAIWPRAAAAAEVFWTGSTLPDGRPRSAREALPRLHDWRYRAVNRGVRAIPLQPEWCALRPGACEA